MQLVKNSSSILRKFLVFNSLIFLILGLFTFFYLKAIQPNLVKQKIEKHTVIINNTSNHIERLKINFETKDLRNFLLSTRFLFQNLERVQFYNIDGVLIGDTNIIDLDQNVFVKSDAIVEENINTESSISKEEPKNKKTINKTENSNINNLITNKKKGEPVVIEREENNNFYVKTLNSVDIKGDILGYIMVTEQANEILTAVEERKNFILRTVFAIAIAIFLFSIFLNKYILTPIAALVGYTESIKSKDDSSRKIEKFLRRSDELGLLSRSLNNMTQDLQNRTRRAENSSADLAHEIRNPLASLKGASELLENTSDQNERVKLIKILSHDVERIERLITDYSQMLKDEASLSREKMKKLDLQDLIKNVVDEFKNNSNVHERNIKFKVIREKPNGHSCQLLGKYNRLEQILANLLDNAVSFSPKNSEVLISIKGNKDTVSFKVKDKGPGFQENNTEKIFKRFYSNRPEKFGQHSGLGLNIVKSIVEMHGGEVRAFNRTDNQSGAEIEVNLPKKI
tara:strand:- start:544 stop:2082 length:1539 start_codon:yes stop_codon:yes gene_type:complete